MWEYTQIYIYIYTGYIYYQFVILAMYILANLQTSELDFPKPKTRAYENEITWQATVGQRSLREVTSSGGLQLAHHNVTARY